jgi:hypothetical protein
VIECLWLPGVDALKGGFYEIDALNDTLVDLVDAGEDVAGGDRRMARSLWRFCVENARSGCWKAASASLMHSVIPLST